MKKLRLLRQALRDPKMGRRAILVLYEILDHFRHDSITCWPSYVRLAQTTRIDKRSVVRIVALLVARGYLRRTGPHGFAEFSDSKGGKGRVNHYVPQFDRSESAHPPVGKAVFQYRARSREDIERRLRRYQEEGE